jgi:hypothetical protein
MNVVEALSGAIRQVLGNLERGSLAPDFGLSPTLGD